MHVWIRYIGLFLSMAIGTFALANEQDTQLLEHVQSVDRPMESNVDDAPLMHSTEESESLFRPHQLHVTLAQHQSQVVVQMIVAAEDVLANSAGLASRGKNLTQDQIQQVQAMVNQLEDLTTTIELPEGAQCKVLEADITSDLTSQVSENAMGSLDFQGIYRLDCDQVEELEWVSIKAFEQFPKLKTALIEWMTREQSGHAIVDPKSTTVHFDERSA